MFSDEEALGLALCLQAARALGLEGAAPVPRGALAKLERVMPEALRDRVRTVGEVVSVAGPRTPARSEVLLTLAAAAGERRTVRMRYRSARSGETEREVDPYGILRREGYWYAVGHCHLRGGVRLFRADRVLGAEMLEGDLRAARGPRLPGGGAGLLDLGRRAGRSLVGGGASKSLFCRVEG